MTTRTTLCGVVLVLLSSSSRAGEVAKMTPVNFSDVTIQSGFWSPRLETNRKVSIPHNLDTCEETGRRCMEKP